MAEIIAENMYLILFLPLWIFLIVMLGRFLSVYVSKWIINLLTAFSSAIGAMVSLILYRLFSPDMVYENTYPFLRIKDFAVSCGIHIDRLSLIFVSVLFLVSFLVQIFSISYMKDEKKHYRFFALLNLFNFVLGMLFFSPNLYQTYVFWEVAAILSYLLIGFDYCKPEKSLASKKVFIINRIGDTALLGGIIMCSYLLYEYAPAKSLVELPFYDMNTISILIGAYTSTHLFAIICGLFILAAFVKSAQMPFYTWLQDAMEAKLPVSALLHSATIVALGVYLIIRLLPLFNLEPQIIKSLMYIGLLTGCVCSLSACVQINPKKSLAYSTSAQFGLVFFAIGVLNIKAAIALFCAHAIIKPMLFIMLPNENEGWKYFKFIIFLVGGLSLSGIMLSGMLAKDLLTINLGDYGKIAVAVLSFLTAFYIIRIALVTVDKHGLEKQPVNIAEILSAIGFLILNTGLCIFIHGLGKYHITESFWAAITAWLVVYVLYIKKAFFKIPWIYSLCLNGFYLDKFYMTIVLWLYNSTSNVLGKFDNYILGNYNPVINISSLCVKITSWIEKNVMNRSVTAISEFCRRVSAIGKQLQTRNVQWYNFYGFTIIVFVMSVLVIAYAAILAYIRGV